VAHKALLASGAQLGMRHVTGEQVQRPPSGGSAIGCFAVEAPYGADLKVEAGF